MLDDEGSDSKCEFFVAKVRSHTNKIPNRLRERTASRGFRRIRAFAAENALLANCNPSCTRTFKSKTLSTRRNQLRIVMQSLLRWGIENSQNGAPVEQTGPAQPLDPKVIDMILGRPDAELMKEALNLALDETKDEESRLTALEDFEMVRNHNLHYMHSRMLIKYNS